MAKFWDQRAKTTLWSAVVLTAITFVGGLYWNNRPEPASQKPPEQPSEGGCIELYVATFCHELTHVETNTGAPLTPLFSKSPKPWITFMFIGSRSCLFGGQTISIEYRVTLGGQDQLVVADYPQLMAEVIPLPKALRKSAPSGNVFRARGTDGALFDRDMFSQVFALSGTYFPDGSLYNTIEYVTLEQSAGACRAFAASQQN